jgi:pSer/pThr/pTyr-binding forkhead associated (FHA) protein
MNDPIAIMLKFGFLAVLYLFLLWVARSALKDVAGGQATALVDDTGPTARPRGMGADLRAGVFPQLEVVAAMGREPGERIDINDGITLGRAPAADLQIDDPFASSVHARIFARGEFMYIEDMGSTNGTFLNGRQLRKPEQLKVADSVRIGDTEYRYQE